MGHEELVGGRLTWIGGKLSVGYAAGYSGTYIMQDGLLRTGVEYIGEGPGFVPDEGASGLFVQSGGLHRNEGSMVLGYEPGVYGRYELSGGALSAGSGIVGYQGRGEFDQSGGTAVFKDRLVLGYDLGGTGVYELSAGSLLVTGDLEVGGYGSGLFTQSGGRLTVQPRLTGGSHKYWVQLSVGSRDGGRGTYTLTGGTVEIQGIEYVRPDSLFVQSGGTDRCVAPAGSIYPEHTFGDLAVGGRYELSSGLLTTDLAEGIGSQGSLAQSGGQNATDMLMVSGGDGGTGVYELSRGSLSVVRGSMGCGAGVGVFNQSGGTSQFAGHLFAGCAVYPPYWTDQENTPVQPPGTRLVTQSGGLCTIGGSLLLGCDLGGTGVYVLSGGSLSAGSGTIGRHGYGNFTQAGGAAYFGGLLVGQYADATGVCTLAWGELTTGGSLIVSQSGKMVQIAGRDIAWDVQVDGHYAMYGGGLTAETLGVTGQFVLWQGADVSISRRLSLGGLGRHSPIFAAERGARIRMTGSQTEVTNQSTDPAAMRGLTQLYLFFDGPGGAGGTIEAAGKDLGPVAAGFCDNFALGVLEVGAGEPRNLLRLLDEFDNQPDWTGSEALYVDKLVLRKGATVGTGGLGLYYCNGGTIKRFFRGDVNLDGVVGTGDLALFGSNWGRSDGGACWGKGDINGDGFVGTGGLALLATDWGAKTDDCAQPAPPWLDASDDYESALPYPDDDVGLPQLSAETVPEPATVALLAAALAVISTPRRRHSTGFVSRRP